MFASLLATAIALTPAPFAEHQATCAGKDGWADSAPPIRIFGNVYDVGSCGIVVLLITGPAGHVLIDGASPEAAPGVLANLRRLGIRPRDVRLMLSTHEHLDHAGALAALQRATGATVRLSPVSKRLLASGTIDPVDPQRTIITPAPRVRSGPPLRDGETIALGPLRVTAHLTPGHSPGGTSWTWRSCEGARCHDMAFADSISAVSADDYRFVDHPDRVSALRASFATVAALPCDLLVTPHPAASRLYERLGGAGPLVDPQGCARYAAEGRSKLDERLARERAR